MRHNPSVGASQMKISTVVVVILWLLFVIGGAASGFDVPTSEHAKSMSDTDSWTFGAMLALPLLLVLSSFRTVYGLWPWPSLTSFLIRLRIELLGAAYCLLFGSVGLIRSFQVGAPRGAFVVSGFFASAGVGCLCSYLILQRRGLLRPNHR
jgi:hypothetical protein